MIRSEVFDALTMLKASATLEQFQAIAVIADALRTTAAPKIELLAALRGARDALNQPGAYPADVELARKIIDRALSRADASPKRDTPANSHGTEASHG